jgi:hypothetical protein
VCSLFSISNWFSFAIKVELYPYSEVLSIYLIYLSVDLSQVPVFHSEKLHIVSGCFGPFVVIGHRFTLWIKALRGD